MDARLCLCINLTVSLKLISRSVLLLYDICIYVTIYITLYLAVTFHSILHVAKTAFTQVRRKWGGGRQGSSPINNFENNDATSQVLIRCIVLYCVMNNCPPQSAAASYSLAFTRFRHILKNVEKWDGSRV